MMLVLVSGVLRQFSTLVVFAVGVLSLTSSSRHDFALQRADAALPEAPSTHLEHEEVFSYDVSRPVTVAVWSKVAQTYEHAKHLTNCNLDLTYASNNGHGKGVTLDPDTDISGADVVLFNLAILSYSYVLPRHKYEGQLWIAFCSEPVNFDEVGLGAGDCRLLKDNATMSVMDAVSSYDSSSDFPSYFTPPTETQMRRERGWSEASSPRALATFASSDCRSTLRMENVAQLNASLDALGEHGAILSYGDCLNTAEESVCSGPEAVQKEEWSDLVITVVNRCMARQFAIITENTESPWYITEKLWFAFASGQVPVYFGTEDVKELVPPGSIIYAKDYGSLDALASALVAFSVEELESAQAFKGRPVSEWGGWPDARRSSHMTLLPRICEAASKRPPLAPGAAKIETPTAPSSMDGRGSNSALRGAVAPMAQLPQLPQECRALKCCGPTLAGCSA